MTFLLLALMALAGQKGNTTTPPTVEDDRAFEGTWELVSRHQGLERLGPERRQIVVKGGEWREGVNGRSLIVHRTTGRPWPRIEMRFGPASKPPRRGAMGGGGMGGGFRGIYRLHGDSLTLAFGPWNGSPPDGLTPAPGRDIEVWRRKR